MADNDWVDTTDKYTPQQSKPATNDDGWVDTTHKYAPQQTAPTQTPNKIDLLGSIKTGLSNAGQAIGEAAQGAKQELIEAYEKSKNATPEQQAMAAIGGADPIGIVPAGIAAFGGLAGQVKALSQGQYLTPEGINQASREAVKPFYEAQDKAPLISGLTGAASAAMMPLEGLVSAPLKAAGKAVTGIGKTAEGLGEAQALKTLGGGQEASVNMLRDNPHLLDVVNKEGLMPLTGDIQTVAKNAAPGTQAAGETLGSLHQAADTALGGGYNPVDLAQRIRKNVVSPAYGTPLESATTKQAQDLIDLLQTRAKKSYADDIKAGFPGVPQEDVDSYIRNSTLEDLQKTFKHEPTLPLSDLSELKNQYQAQNLEVAGNRTPGYSAQAGSNLAKELRSAETDLHGQAFGTDSPEFQQFLGARNRYWVGKDLETAANYVASKDVSTKPTSMLQGLVGPAPVSGVTTNALQKGVSPGLEAIGEGAQAAGRAVENPLLAQPIRQELSGGIKGGVQAALDPRTIQQRAQDQSSFLTSDPDEQRVVAAARTVTNIPVRNMLIKRQLGEQRGQEVINQLDQDSSAPSQ